MARKDARAWAMRLMYARDLGGENIPDCLQSFLDEERPHMWRPEDQAYVSEVLEGTAACMQELDEKLTAHTHNWRLERLSRLDLAIMRLAVYEILHREDVPAEVAINEAVELAKQYGGQDSRGFINGVLSSLLRDLQEAKP